MGTRGLRIIRFRGRYFVYYNQLDSYPESLGTDIVNRIPNDRKRYKGTSARTPHSSSWQLTYQFPILAWLEKERAIYAEINDEFESEVVTISEEELRDLLAIEETRNNKSKVYPHWRKLDAELYDFPTTLCDSGNDLMIEWVYLIDLDSELFAINNWVFFDLWNIPNKRWMHAFGDNDEGEDTFSAEVCPEASFYHAPKRYTYFAGVPAEERENYLVQFQSWPCVTVQTTSKVNVSSPAALQQVISIILFESFTQRNTSRFWEYFTGWSYTDFAFREVAFAMLSLAAGQFSIDNPNRFHGYFRKYDSDGYLIDRNEGGSPKLMPLFGSGYHVPDQEPGSAPSGTIYWFENVLVSLVPDTIFERDTEAAIAKAVDYGLKTAKVDFQAVLFSVCNAIMLEICITDGIVTKIKRTGTVLIHDARRANARGGYNEDDESDTDEANFSSPMEKLVHVHSGFVSLQNFFEVAAHRALGGFTCGFFPPEIYSKIITHVNHSTRSACAKVSRMFRPLCQESFSFGNNLIIVKFEPSNSHPPPGHFVKLDHMGVFTFFHRDTGHITQSGISLREEMHDRDEKKVSAWCPIVGGATRPSMITQCQL
ncbi:hypothetical protein B7463_g10550, partial [Scytalidium lignicola]